MSFAKILAGRYPGHQKLFSYRALSELNPPRARRIAQAMLTLLFSLRDCFRARAVLQAEILALRHQLLVLQRSSRLHKLRLYWADRVLWVWLSRLWNDWRSALLLVKPETVIAWHRKGFRRYWRWKSRHLEGRPSVSNEVRNLIRKMSLANLAGSSGHPWRTAEDWN